MNRIEEMIREMCPEGVKRVKLEEVCTRIFAGGTPNTRHSEYYDGDIPWIRSGEIDFNRIYAAERNITKEGYENSSAKLMKGKSVVIAMTGATVAKVATVEIPSSANQSVCSLEPNRELLHYRYLYFCLSCNYHAIKSSAQGALTSLNLQNIKAIEIPLPPLSIQQEIVNILDKFTSLQQNLEDELKLRQKQYEYYCDKLYGGDYEGMMNMDGVDGAKVIKLADLGTITRGKRFVRDDVREKGQPCIHYGDMYTYYGTKAKTTKTHLDRNFPKKMRYAKKGDVVIVGAGENNYDIGVGLVWMGDEPAAVHDACYILEHSINPMYISYFLRSSIYHLQLKKFVSEGKICSFSGTDLGRILIPIQSSDKQSQIVQTLDHFESLISNIKTEIELRKKQYEYYREKLLTF